MIAQGRLVVALGICVLAGALAWLVVRGPTNLERLQAQPELGLRFPGAIVVATGGIDADYKKDSVHPAAAWVQAGSSASVEAVIQFFESGPEASGWQRGAGASIIGSQWDVQVCGWHRSDTELRLGFWKPASWAQQHPGEPTYESIYDLRLIDGPPEVLFDEPCWQPRS